MNQKLDQDEREALLLELIGGRTDIPSAENLARMTEEDWTALERPIQQHRLRPLLHWRLTQDKPALAPLVPEKTRQQFAEGFRSSALRSLKFQRELIQVCTLLEQADIDCIALKGAYLAYFAYPHPALRPMRDLDILVIPERGLEAFNFLLERGYTQSPITPGDPEAYIQLSKHYPILISPNGISIELHTRLSETYYFKSGEDDLGLDQQIWQRSQLQTLANCAIRFLSPEDLLFHLSVHAVVNHKMSCGPLFFSDLFYLIQINNLDFSYLNQQSKQKRMTEVINLSLQLHQQYNDFNSKLHLHFPASETNSAQRQRISALLLADLEYHGAHLHDSHNAETALKKFQSLSQRLFPSPLIVRAKYPLAIGRLDLIRAYFQHWSRTFGELLPIYLASKLDLRARKNLKTSRWIDEWLKQ